MQEELDVCNLTGVTLHRSLWSVPVSRHQVAAHLISALRSFIPSLAKRSRGVKKSNRGGWHSAGSDLLNGLPSNLARQVRAVLLTAASEYIKSAGGEAVQLSLLGVWANVNGPGHSNVAHSHPGLLSGALYVDPGSVEGAVLCLSDPRMAVPADESWRRCMTGADAWDSSGGMSVEGLNSGDLLLFPSWLQHHVPPHNSTEPRISVSFNLRADLNAGSFDRSVDVEMLGVKELFGSDALQSQSDPDEVKGLAMAMASVETAEPPLGLFASRTRPPPHLASALAASSLAKWRCLAQHQGSRLAATQASVALLTLPAGFVQPTREHRPVLAAAAAVLGFQVLQGRVRLWLYDPRLQVEVAAAADPVARRLFGRKVAFELGPGELCTFPAWLPTALEASEAAAVLNFAI